MLGKMKAPSKGQGLLSTGIVPQRPGQVLCGDTFGPIAVPGLAGERYLLVLVCQYTRYGFVRSFQSLSDVPNLIEEILAEARSLLDKSADQVHITVHTDNASYFNSSAITKRMAELNVTLSYSAPYEPRTNPYAERYGGVLLSLVRSVIIDGSFPPKFWSVLVRTTAWTLNWVVRPCGVCPLEKYTGKKPDFSNVHPAGVLAYWHVDKKHRADSKLGNAAAVGVYLGSAEAFGARWHAVYMANDRLRIV
jgi:transposase InsO family protein